MFGSILGSAAWVADWGLDVIKYLVRLVIALICGILIGMERKSRSKEAGIRTHAIVCMATCLMMIISKYAFLDVDAATQKVTDTARIAAQVVTGIGFLGSGIIFYKRDFLHGLTTAAGIWATAAIGLALGAGMIITGLIVTALLLILQILFHKPVGPFKSKTVSVIKVTMIMTEESAIQRIKEELHAQKLIRFKTTKTEKGIVADVEVATNDHFTEESLFNIAANDENIITMENIDEI